MNTYQLILDDCTSLEEYLKERCHKFQTKPLDKIWKNEVIIFGQEKLSQLVNKIDNSSSKQFIDNVAQLFYIDALFQSIYMYLTVDELFDEKEFPELLSELQKEATKAYIERFSYIDKKEIEASLLYRLLEYSDLSIVS
ncbi:hypothetical protein [Enterococcus sp. LJL90]